MNPEKILIQRVFQEITTNTISGAYTNLVETGKAELFTLKTFGFLNTPIIEDETGETVGFIVSWENGNITACHIDQDAPETCILMAIYDEYDIDFTCDVAVTIYRRVMGYDDTNS